MSLKLPFVPPPSAISQRYLKNATNVRKLPRMLNNIPLGHRSSIISIQKGHIVSLYSFTLPTPKLAINNHICFSVHTYLRPIPKKLLNSFYLISRAFAEFQEEIISHLNLQDTLTVISALTECTWANIAIRESATGTIISLKPFSPFEAQNRLQRLYDLCKLYTPEPLPFKAIEIIYEMKKQNKYEQIQKDFNFSFAHIFASIARIFGFRAFPSSENSAIFEHENILYEVDFSSKTVFSPANGGLQTRDFDLNLKPDEKNDEFILTNRALHKTTVLLREGEIKHIYTHFYTKVRTFFEIENGPNFEIAIEQMGRFCLILINFTGQFEVRKEPKNQIRNEILLWKRLENRIFSGICSCFRTIPSRLYNQFEIIYQKILAGGGTVKVKFCNEKDIQMIYSSLVECFWLGTPQMKWKNGDIVLQIPGFSAQRIQKMFRFMTEMIRPYLTVGQQPKILTAISFILNNKPTDITNQNFQFLISSEVNQILFFHYLCMRLSIPNWICGEKLIIFQEGTKLYQVNFKSRYDIFYPKVDVIQAMFIDFYSVPQLVFEDWKIVFQLRLQPQVLLIRKCENQQILIDIQDRLNILNETVTFSVEKFNTYSVIKFITGRLQLIVSDVWYEKDPPKPIQLYNKMAYLRYIQHNITVNRNLAKRMFYLSPLITTDLLFEKITKIMRRRPFYQYKIAATKKEDTVPWLEVSFRMVAEFPTLQLETIQRLVEVIFLDDIPVSSIHHIRKVLQTIKNQQQLRIKKANAENNTPFFITD